MSVSLKNPVSVRLCCIVFVLQLYKHSLPKMIHASLCTWLGHGWLLLFYFIKEGKQTHFQLKGKTNFMQTKNAAHIRTFFANCRFNMQGINYGLLWAWQLLETFGIMLAHNSTRAATINQLKCLVSTLKLINYKLSFLID